MREHRKTISTTTVPVTFMNAQYCHTPDCRGLVVRRGKNVGLPYCSRCLQNQHKRSKDVQDKYSCSCCLCEVEVKTSKRVTLCLTCSTRVTNLVGYLSSRDFSGYKNYLAHELYYLNSESKIDLQVLAYRIYKSPNSNYYH